LASLGEIVEKVRSKNAGPFWLTVDIFCGASDVYDRLQRGLKTTQLAALFQVDEASIKRFDIADLHVIKFSLKRPEIQGSVADRDMHGASWATLVSELELAD
jgi:hypothetical protein